MEESPTRQQRSSHDLDSGRECEGTRGCLWDPPLDGTGARGIWPFVATNLSLLFQDQWIPRLLILMDMLFFFFS